MELSKSAEKHKPGTYIARPVDWAITKTKAGLPQVCVCFRYNDGVDKDIVWYGSFKDTVVERTVDTLISMGLQGSLETLADGCLGTALSKEKPMEIVVEHRQDMSGKLQAGVAWVNDPAKSRLSGKVEKAEAAMLLSGYNAILMQRKPQQQSDFLKQGQAEMAASELPF
jgi:hypothetical protein